MQTVMLQNPWALFITECPQIKGVHHHETDSTGNVRVLFKPKRKAITKNKKTDEIKSLTSKGKYITMIVDQPLVKTI